MKRYTIITILSLFLFFAFIDTSVASPFMELKDTFGFKNFDSKRISECFNYHYQHDLSDDIDFSKDYINAASYQLDFTNDWIDGIFTKEYVSVSFDHNNWYDLGEVDNGQSELTLNKWEIDLMNDNQYLDVWVSVDNKKNFSPGTVWVDHLMVSGKTASVPLPGAIWLLGSGLLGLIGFGRKKLF